MPAPPLFATLNLPLMIATILLALPRTTAACEPDPTAYALSYPAPRSWPFPPWRIVLETRPGTCNLYGSPAVCRKFSSGDAYEPEFHVRDAIASVLLRCLNVPADQRPCHTLDFGMNTGYFTAAMASLGAHVVAVEGAPDHVDAFEQTKRVNCWQHTVELHNAYLSLMKPIPKGRTHKAGIPMRPISWDFGEVLNVSDVPLVDPHKFLFMAGGSWDLIKIDIDSMDTWLVHDIQKQISQGHVAVNAILFENNVMGDVARLGRQARTDLGVDDVEVDGWEMEVLRALLGRFQQLGYDVFMLDVHSHLVFGEQPVHDAKGRNIGARPTWRPPPGVVAHEHVRAMRHVYHFQKNLTRSEWRVALPGKNPAPINYLVIREPLLEARRHLIHSFDFRDLREKYDLPKSMADKLPMCGPRGIKGVTAGKNRFELVPCKHVDGYPDADSG